jgi:hypothetical protein
MSKCGPLGRCARIYMFWTGCGSSSAVERELPKLDVAGSIPVSRSNLAHDCRRRLPATVVGLDGKDATTVTETVLKNLPGGRYEIVVALFDTRGEQTVETMTILVTSPPGRP